MKNKYLILFIILLISLNASSQIRHVLNGQPLEQSPELILNEERLSQSLFSNAIRARKFYLNSELFNAPSLIVGSQIDMHLFENRKFTGTIFNKSIDNDGATTLTIKLDAFRFAHAFLSISKNSYLLNVHIPELNESYRTRTPRLSGDSYLIQQDKSTIKDLSCGLSIDESLQKTQDSKEPYQTNQLINPSETCLTLPSSGDMATIDILVVYTDAAETWATDNDGNISNTINTAEAQANLISTNNNLGINFNVVHSAKVTYTEVSAGSDLEALRNSTDGIMDDVHDLRKTHNADLVCIFTYLPDDGIGGIANLLDTRYGHPGKAFSNVKVDSADNIYTFTHEIAHTMGANHYRSQSEAPGPTVWLDWPSNDWSSGWRDQDGNDFKTIMTYRDGLSDPSIPYLSDPNINHGSGDPIGDTALADNARTLREVKHEVSRYSNAIQYCLAGIEGFDPNIYYISTVNMGDINHSSFGSFYSDLSGLATCMEPGDTQTLTVDIFNTGSSSYLAVWIDWDDDKVFEESELEFNSIPGLPQYSVDITAPLGFSAGQKRMRIRTYNTSSGGSLDPCGYFSFGEVEDYTINLGEGTPCNNASIPQNLVVENISGSQATISWDAYSGVDFYELEYRKVGDPSWNMVSNIVYPFYTITGLDVRTDYEVQVRSVCGAPTDFSSILEFTSGDYDYCNSSSNNAGLGWIARVQLNSNSIDNTSANENGGYSDFTNISTSLEQGSNYELTITPGYPDAVYGLGYGVWIDYNYDGDFDDQFEQIFESTSLEPGNSTKIIPFTVPYGAVPGPTRLRIIARVANIPSACGSYSHGETEDYTVILGEGPACTAAPTPTGLTFENPELSWDFVPGGLYDIRYRETGATTWIEILDHPYNSIMLDNLVALTEYEAQVRSKCGDSEISAYSDSLIFTVNYCDAGATDTNSNNEKISNVNFIHINNPSSSGAGYEDFTGISTSANLGETYPITIDISNLYPDDEVFIWIDFNQDGIFSDDENVVDDAIDLTNELNPVDRDITIPEDANLGFTRMRIRLLFPSANQLNRTPCGNSIFGQVEDYTLNIVDPSLSIEDTLLDNFKVYPNPFDDMITLKRTYVSSQILLMKIYDVSGKTIRSQKFMNQGSTLTISSLSTLKSGMYFIEITDVGTKSKTIRKIIKY